MAKAHTARRKRLRVLASSLVDDKASPLTSELKELISQWIANFDKPDMVVFFHCYANLVLQSVALSKKILPAIQSQNLASNTNEDVREFANNSDQLIKQSQWIFGGDGWA